MISVRGKQTSEIDAVHVGEIVARFASVTIDVGAGDGAFAYRYAKAHADRLVIGLDPVAENLREYSARAARKAERGGLSNVIYVVASIERVPPELRGVADEILVTLPWGSLMRGIILGEEVMLGGLASMGREGAALSIVLNTRIFDDPVPIQVRDLPELTPDYVRVTLAPAFARHGIAIDDARWMEAEEVAGLGTTWAKRLSHRSPPRSVFIAAAIGARS